MVAGRRFWHVTLDILHWANLHLTSPKRGFVTFSKHDWLDCFYRERKDDVPGLRAWERWKAAARKNGILCLVDGVSGVDGKVVIAMNVDATNDVIYRALGAPHPGGIFAQVDYEERQRKLLAPRVVRGIAAAVRVEQQRRGAG